MGRFGRVWGGWGMAGNLANQTTFEQLISEGALEIGDGYRAKNDELGGDGLIFLRAGHVNDTHIDFEGVDRFQAKLAPRLQSKIAQAGDTVITTKGNSTGRCTFISPTMPPFVYSPHVSYWRSLDLDKLEPGFLRYWCKGSEFGVQLSAMKASTDMAPYLSLGDQKRLRITLPPISEQRAIAHILGNLDDKIELNRRMNATLEAMARAIFKSWFVDFDPVRAKSEGRAPEGLAPEIAALFPDGFEDSELGEIPKGWSVKPVGELSNIVGGSTPSTKNLDYWEGGNHQWATPKDLSGLSVPVLLCTERKVTDEGLAQISSGLLPAGTVLLSSRAPIGYLAITEIPVAINQGFIAMQPKKGIPNLFFLYWAELFHDEIVSRANGSTFLEISKANFRPIPIATPSPEVFGAFEKIVRPLYRRLVANEQESRTLATLRDTLLPKLLSGELRAGQVSDTLDKVVS
jgi:type I restriction enzyme S subunit